MAAKAACIGLVLRNDYDSATGLFSNSSAYPTKEVEICTWSAGVPRNGSLGNLTINNGSYELCSQNGISADNLTQWPTYLFLSNSNSLSVTNLDVLSFVHHIHQNNAALTNHYATGIYFGFRIYTGCGRLVYASDPQLTAFVPTPPPQPPAPSPSPSPSPNSIPNGSISMADVPISCPFSDYNPGSRTCQLTHSVSLI